MEKTKEAEKLPHDIVCEFMGGVEFQGNDEVQVELADQIASQRYSSMESLIQTVEGYAKSKRAFKKFVEECRKGDFFGKYFKKV